MPCFWNAARRSILPAELDAGFFRLSGFPRVEVDYVIDSFPIVRRHGAAIFDGYRTNRLVLEFYEALTAGAASGQSHTSSLPPGGGLDGGAPGR